MGVKYSGASQLDNVTYTGNPDIQVPAGDDLTIKLGDTAAANKLSVTDSSDVEVMNIDSDGAINF